MSATGVIRMQAGRNTYLVPPTRALWIPPGVEHVVTVVEDAEIRTSTCTRARFLGADGADTLPALAECRVLGGVAAAARAGGAPRHGAGQRRRRRTREACLAALILDELRRAAPVRLGIALPTTSACAGSARRCWRHRRAGARWSSGRARSAPARARWRDCSATSWARASCSGASGAALARRDPGGAQAADGHIAAELGYASASAFTAMVRRTLGAPPTQFFA